MPDNIEEKNPSSNLSGEEMQALFDELKRMDDEDDEMNLDDVGSFSDMGSDLKADFEGTEAAASDDGIVPEIGTDIDDGVPELEANYDVGSTDSNDNLDLDSILSSTETFDSMDDEDMDLSALLESEEMAEIEKKLTEFESSLAQKQVSVEDSSGLSEEDEQARLDEQILKALEADKMMDLTEEQFIGNTEMSLVNDVSVYDSTERSGAKEIIDQPEDEPEKLSPLMKKISGIPAKRLYIASAILALLVCVAGAAAVTLASRYKPPSEFDGVGISIPKYTSNDANFIYRNDVFEFGQKTYKLTKMLIDSAATVFFFDGHFDLSAVNISITDDKGREYFRDMGYVPPNVLKDINPTTTAQFRPFEEDVRSFTIRLDDPQHNEKFDISYYFQEELQFAPARYLSKDYVEGQEENPQDIVIESGMFTSSGSVIDVSLSWGVGMVRLGNDIQNDVVVLSEAGKTIVPRYSLPESYIFPGERKALIRMDYEPIKNLNSTLGLTFKNLYREYEINLSRTPGSLYMNRSDVYESYMMDNYRLNLERFFYMDDKALLIFHVQDMNVPRPDLLRNEIDNPFYNRVQGQLDVELSVETTDGETWNMKGRNRSGPIGSDVIFDFPGGKDSSSKIKANTFIIKMNSALVKKEDITIPIDLSRDGRFYESPSDEIVKGIIEEFFTKRLKYKSGEIKKSELTGFSSEILNDHEIMKNYSPNTAAKENSSFSVQTVSASVGNNDMICVVKEFWRGPDQLQEFSATHKVKALADKESWVIVEDEIIFDERTVDNELSN